MSPSPDTSPGPEQQQEQEQVQGQEHLFPDTWDVDTQQMWGFPHDQITDTASRSTPSYAGFTPKSYDYEQAIDVFFSYSHYVPNEPTGQHEAMVSPGFFGMDQTGLSSMWISPSSANQAAPSEAQVSPSLLQMSESSLPYTPENTWTQPWARSTDETLRDPQDFSATSIRQPGLGTVYSPPLSASPTANTLLSLTAPFEGYPTQAYQQPPTYPPPFPFEPAFTRRPMIPFAATTSNAGAVQGRQLANPDVTLVQLGASQNHLVNNQPAPWIRALDVDPSYRGPGTSSPGGRTVLSLYVRIPDYEPYYRALYLRELTVQEFIRCVGEKYGLNAHERGRISRVVIRTPIGTEPVDDHDISVLRNETEMFLRCAPVQGDVDVWQLEVS